MGREVEERDLRGVMPIERDLRGLCDLEGGAGGGEEGAEEVGEGGRSSASGMSVSVSMGSGGKWEARALLALLVWL